MSVYKGVSSYHENVTRVNRTVATRLYLQGETIIAIACGDMMCPNTVQYRIIKPELDYTKDEFVALFSQDCAIIGSAVCYGYHGTYLEFYVENDLLD